MAFLSFDFEITWWRLFQKRVVRTKLCIYIFDLSHECYSRDGVCCVWYLRVWLIRWVLFQRRCVLCLISTLFDLSDKCYSRDGVCCVWYLHCLTYQMSVIPETVCAVFDIYIVWLIRWVLFQRRCVLCLISTLFDLSDECYSRDGVCCVWYLHCLTYQMSVIPETVCAVFDIYIVWLIRWVLFQRRCVLCLISTFLTYQMSVIPETVCAVFDIYIVWLIRWVLFQRRCVLFLISTLFDLSDECYSRDGVCCAWYLHCLTYQMSVIPETVCAVFDIYIVWLIRWVLFQRRCVLCLISTLFDLSDECYSRDGVCCVWYLHCLTYQMSVIQETVCAVFDIYIVWLIRWVLFQRRCVLCLISTLFDLSDECYSRDGVCCVWYLHCLTYQMSVIPETVCAVFDIYIVWLIRWVLFQRRCVLCLISTLFDLSDECYSRDGVCCVWYLHCLTYQMSVIPETVCAVFDIYLVWLIRWVLFQRRCVLCLISTLFDLSDECYSRDGVCCVWYLHCLTYQMSVIPETVCAVFDIYIVWLIRWVLFQRRCVLCLISTLFDLSDECYSRDGVCCVWYLHCLTCQMSVIPETVCAVFDIYIVWLIRWVLFQRRCVLCLISTLFDLSDECYSRDGVCCVWYLHCLTYQMSVIPETVCAVFDIYIVWLIRWVLFQRRCVLCLISTLFDLSDECYSRDGMCCVWYLHCLTYQMSVIPETVCAVFDIYIVWLIRWVLFQRRCVLCLISTLFDLSDECYSRDGVCCVWYLHCLTYQMSVIPETVCAVFDIYIVWLIRWVLFQRRCVLCLISTFLTYQMSVIPETVCAVFDIYVFIYLSFPKIS